MITGRIKAFRFIKEPKRMGLAARLSEKISPIRVKGVKTSMMKKAGEDQPRFCPKDGIHNTRLKKSMINIAPALSKALIFFVENEFLGCVKKHKARNVTDNAAQIHINIRQLKVPSNKLPRVGPKITALLEISI